MLKMNRTKSIKSSLAPSGFSLSEENIYVKIFHNSPSPKTLSNKKDRKIVDVNKTWEKFAGYKREEVIGQRAEDLNLVTFKEADSIRDILSKKNILESYEIEVKKKNGDSAFGIATFQFITIHNNTYLESTILDISERIKFQKELKYKSEKSIQKKDTILQLVDLVGKDFEVILKDITEISAKVLNVNRVSIWEFNNDDTKIHCLNAYHLKPRKFVNDITLQAKDYPKYFKLLHSNKTISIDDAVNSNFTKNFTENYLKTFGISSMLDVFIRGTDKPFGVICFEHIGKPRKWTAEDEEFATIISSIVSLVVENYERKNVEEKLVLEKEFSEELIDSLQEGLSVVNKDGVCIKVNKALCKMTGFNENELVGCKPPFKYWLPESYESMFECFNLMMKERKTNKLATFMRKNGERFPISVSLSSIKDKNGKPIAYFSTIIDITERIKEEEALKKKAEVSQKRKEVITELVAMIGKDYESTIKQITKLTALTLDVDFVSIWKYENDNNELLNKISYHAKSDSQVEHDRHLSRADHPKLFNVLDNKSILNINQVHNHPIAEFCTKDFSHSNNHVISCLNAIIHEKNKHYGMICFESCGEERIFNDEEESFATSIATIISLMVEGKERKAAENKLIKTNEKLLHVNTELSKLKKELEQQNVYLREEIDLTFNYEEMVYSSAAFSQVLTEVETVASTSATVLLLGESGTGKELLARAIHNISDRKSKPLIKVNCASIPKELIESELFGHKKGSFTGAFKDKLGKFKLADGGTLFLDEIGELSLELQPKLLRAIQESEIEQIGSSETQKVDIRIITATNRDLKKEVKRKNFREDLYFRINVFPIYIPPLRERTEDIPILIEHFVNKYSKEYNKKIKYISEEAKNSLYTYNWPGNIRELENLIQRAVILSNDENLNLPNIKSSVKEQLISSTTLSLNEVQRLHILKTLKKCKWKVDGDNGAAKVLELKPSTLRDKMKKLHIKRPNK